MEGGILQCASTPLAAGASCFLLLPAAADAACIFETKTAKAKGALLVFDPDSGTVTTVVPATK